MTPEYPKNRIYAIFPANTATTELKEKKSLARARRDKHSVIWDYHERTPILEKLKALPGVKLFTHDQALKEMQKETWQKPEELTKLNQTSRAQETHATITNNNSNH